jgi:hypothetical protein
MTFLLSLRRKPAYSADANDNGEDQHLNPAALVALQKEPIEIKRQNHAYHLFRTFVF